MAVEKAPYINYTEVTSYMDNLSNSSEVPLFLVKTNNTVTLSDITSENIKRCNSYSAFKKAFNIDDEEDKYDELPASIKELDALLKDYFIENSMYGSNDEYGLASPYVYIIDVGSNPQLSVYLKALEVSEKKRNSTVVVFPNTEDVSFMKQVKTKLMTETKSGLLRIAYFGINGQGESTSRFAKGTAIIPTTNADNYTAIVEGYRKTEDGKFYAKYDSVEKTFSEKITSASKNTIYIDKLTTKEENSAYKYNDDDFATLNVNVNKNAVYLSTDSNYKFLTPSTKKEMGGVDETFEEYCNRIQYISQEVQSSRVAIVEKEHLGKTIARICSTPYYIEPGYLPYMSVNQGVFKERSSDERDELFATGLIFNEDDYTLSTPTPRICLATSTAWGVDDYDMRTTDALIHARRNVDYHVRRILNILAPQLKRNETSVNIRHVHNQIDLYLDNELSNGTIQEYQFSLVESNYNPYTLLVRGRITPVNSTLGIDFENTVGSPYTIASDYV